MRRHEPFAIVLDERQEVVALRCRQIDLADAEEEDRVEVVQVANIELFAARDAGPRRKRDRMLRDQLRVGADERIVGAGLAAKSLDAIVVNDVSQPGIGFDSERNAVTILTASESTAVLETTKWEAAQRVLDQAVKLKQGSALASHPLS